MTTSQFYKGQPKTPGSGRKKGTPNKKTKEMRKIHDRITNFALERVQLLAGDIDQLAKYQSAHILLRLIQMSLRKAPPPLE